MFRIEIQFKGGPSYETTVSASNKQQAEEKAKAEARLSGFNDPVKKVKFIGG